MDYDEVDQDEFSIHSEDPNGIQLSNLHDTQKPTEQIKRVNHRARFRLCGGLECGTRYSGTITFAIIMVLSAIFQQIKFNNTFIWKIEYWHEKMVAKYSGADNLVPNPSGADAVFIFIFAVLPIGFLISIPVISASTYGLLIYATYAKNPKLFPPGIIFGWLNVWFLFLDICSNSRCLVQRTCAPCNVNLCSPCEPSRSVKPCKLPGIAWLPVSIELGCEIIGICLIMSMLLEVMDYMREQEEVLFQETREQTQKAGAGAGEFHNATPRIMLLFTIAAIIYSLYAIF